jgi:hypothetical protein
VIEGLRLWLLGARLLKLGACNGIGRGIGFLRLKALGEN